MRVPSFIGKTETWRRPLEFIRGLAQVFDGLVSVLSFGFLISNVSFHLTFESSWFERFGNFLEEGSES